MSIKDYSNKLFAMTDGRYELVAIDQVGEQCYLIYWDNVEDKQINKEVDGSAEITFDVIYETIVADYWNKVLKDMKVR